MHTISKKLAKREKRARFPTSERKRYFGVASGYSLHSNVDEDYVALAAVAAQ